MGGVSNIELCPRGSFGLGSSATGSHIVPPLPQQNRAKISNSNDVSEGPLRDLEGRYGVLVYCIRFGYMTLTAEKE
jgi:hypothetical protein